MAKRTTVDPATRMVKELKKTKEWHHDIKYIDGQFVEQVVGEFQDSNDERLINKIIDNYAIFRKRWGKAFAVYLDNDLEDGEQMHDMIVFRSATKFKIDKARKKRGKSFNAYLVSALLNQLKNLRNARMSHKNHPRAQCPICHELVYQIDAKHLQHTYTLQRYKKAFPTYPLASHNGMTLCPVTGVPTESITMEHMNRFQGHYTVEDFQKEYRIVRRGPYRCPVTGTSVDRLTQQYFQGLLTGFTAEKFAEEYPNYPGLLTCPFSGKRVVEITQEHLDSVFDQDGSERRYTKRRFSKEYPNFTTQAKQVKVINPYTGSKVAEITPAMLAKAGTNLKEHLGKYKTIVLEKYYYELIVCPFTGRRTHMIKRSDLEQMGKTVQDFYQVTCRHPLRKFQVKCAICGDWVDNVWSHLEEKEHNYAPRMRMGEFERTFGVSAAKKTVSTNSFVESDSGDTVHIADLFAGKLAKVDHLEVEDSLLEVAQDELDRRVAMAVRCSHTVDDVYFLAGERCALTMDRPFEGGSEEKLKRFVRDETGASDFDIAKAPKAGEKQLEIMVPSKSTIKKRIKRMLCESDLVTAEE